MDAKGPVSGPGASTTAHAWDVWLNLNGRTRRSRNAIEPDLVAAIGKYERKRYGGIKAVALVMGPLYLLALPAGVGIPLAMDALGLWTWLGLIVFCVVFMGLWGLVHNRQMPAIMRLVRAIELLPDNGVSVWDTMWARRRQQARVAGAVVVGLATVGALIVAILKD